MYTIYIYTCCKCCKYCKRSIYCKYINPTYMPAGIFRSNKKGVCKRDHVSAGFDDEIHERGSIFVAAVAPDWLGCNFLFCWTPEVCIFSRTNWRSNALALASQSHRWLADGSSGIGCMPELEYGHFDSMLSKMTYHRFWCFNCTAMKIS